MRLLAVVSLLACLALEAQTVSTVEQVYGPYARPRTGAAPAVAANRNGVLLAWSEVAAGSGVETVRYGLLDFNGRLVSPVAIVPTAPGMHAFAPFVASDGETFLLVWAEDSYASLEDARSIGLHIDASGRATTEPIIDSARNPEWLAWDGADYVLGVGGGGEVRIRANGERIATFGDSLGVPVSGARVHAQSQLRACWGAQCAFLDDITDVTWTIDGTWGSRGFHYGTASQPAFAGDGERFLLVWSSPRGIEGLLVTRDSDAPAFVIPAAVDMKRPPAVAFDGMSYLVSWSEHGAVFGLLVHSDGVAGTPFAIATSLREEDHPGVYALHAGRFLVSYESDLPFDERLAGRIITTAPPKQRAIR